jgi:DNA-binding NtrC family response regulator
MKKAKILIIDDERNTREGLKKALAYKYEVFLAEDGNRGMEILQQETIDMVLTDLRMPGMDGMTFIKRASSHEDAPLIIMLTAYGSVQTAVDAMKVGAYDYLTKPVNLDNLEMLVERGLDARRLQLENARLRKQLNKRQGFEGLIGNSRPMAEVFDTIEQVASARTTVLITGESGTGKELVAQALHNLSPRRLKPFVVVHCASLNANLLESELFGHEKGAFTGASERRAGRFEKADGGTLFLDEIGEIDASTQVKLLRVLETRRFERVGGAQSLEVDVRLVSATNQDLPELVAAGKFREDLYYRLNVVRLHLPPLRERPDDIELLLNHFLKDFTKENAKELNGFTPEALKVLTAYSWVGNVRELRNCVERMVVMARGSSLTLGDVPPEIRGAVSAELDSAAEVQVTTAAATGEGFDLNANERNLVIKALRDCDGNRTRAAEKLGISRRTLHRKIHTFDLEGL